MNSKNIMVTLLSNFYEDLIGFLCDVANRERKKQSENFWLKYIVKQVRIITPSAAID